NNEKTILDEIYVSSGSMDEGKARGLLASMLFKGDDVLKKIGKLSLGERSRVMLSKFMAERSNFLIIDEPLNNLDIVSGELLQRGLQNYDGTLLTVSHDRSFINGLCNKIWYLENGMIHTFNGNYDLFKEYYEE
ncbi:MAG: ATP-binding cassette domain-containing protein, partial [Nanoarchaeota archaeon]|nr:ATP-binding cassette domain-containing protein [Nanoarchaeota archaeon]